MTTRDRFASLLRLGSATVVGVVATALNLLAVVGLNRPLEPEPKRSRSIPSIIEVSPAPTPTVERAPSLMPTVTPMTSAALPPQAPVRPAAPADSSLPELGMLPSMVGAGLPLPQLGSGGGEGMPDALSRVEERPAVLPVTPATPLGRPSPRYPPAAQRQGIEGVVVLRLAVDASGRVSDAMVVSADPPGVFELAAKEAARQYRFQPARRGGKAVMSTVEQRVVFRLRR